MSAPALMMAVWDYVLAHFGGLLPTASHPADLIAAVALAAAAALAVAIATHVVLAIRPRGGHQARYPAAARRQHIRRQRVIRHSDPDARGRARPRAPSAYPSAA